MDTEILFSQIKQELDTKLHFLEDKPEETSDSTLRACWHTASGSPRSAEEANKIPLAELTKKQIDILYNLVEKRLNNIPLAYITGRQSFMGIEMLADKRALIPRKETEILGRKALDVSIGLAKEKKWVRVMDICAGSGNLGLAIAYHNPKTVVFATDLSHEAVEHSKDNISFLNLHGRVQVEQGDLFAAFEKEQHYRKADIIVCNPPYISTGKVAKMNWEISGHEPVMAFDGGMFGTKIIQKLLAEAPKFLSPNGWLLFEVGLGQGPFIMDICERTGNYRQIQSINDANNNIRVIMAQEKS
jgi:release factor glutamine methyltransferase